MVRHGVRLQAPSLAIRLLGAFALAGGLSGCDLLLLAPTMPGALIGKVVDARTGLPVGKATVQAGWGFATTDNAGNFTLVGDFSGGHAIALCRAGYVSSSLEYGKLAQGDTYYLTPSFVTSGTQTTRVLNLSGTLLNASGNAIESNGNVSFGDAVSKPSENNGRYSLQMSAGFPGSIYSAVLAGGMIAGGPVAGDAAFNYQNFGYRLVDVPTLTADSTWSAQANVQVQPEIVFTDMAVTYKGLEVFTNPSPRTEVTLDFGLLGSVLVGRGFSTNQALRVPKVDGAKYVIEGKVSDDTLHTTSMVSITTNQIGQPSLTLLAPPKVLSPKDGTAKAGATPTFSWTTVPNASYYVELSLDTGNAAALPIWRGYTRSTSIRYPGFWPSDANGGALRGDATYSWAVHAVDSMSGFNAPVSVSPDISDKPFRQARRESITSGMRFSP